MLIENDKIILIFSTHSKPWAFAIDSGRGVGRLIPRCRPWPWLLIQAFAVGRLIPRCRRFATVQAVSGHTPQAVGVVLDSGFCRGSTDTKV